MLNLDLRDTQTTYGQGRDASKVADAIDTYQAWGPKMDGSMVAQWDGVSRPYTNKGSNLDKFYQTGETYTNTIAISHSDEKGSTRFC